MARVRHPNVVTIFGAERIDGRVGLWMEFVDGPTLEDELKTKERFEPRGDRRWPRPVPRAERGTPGRGLAGRVVGTVVRYFCAVTVQAI